MKLTPWFVATKKPSRIGLYEVEHSGWQGWSWFDGKGFNGVWSQAESAISEKTFFARTGHRGVRVEKWRGLATKDGK
jgi:hypothetical protein